jgi:hypothetical protein
MLDVTAALKASAGLGALTPGELAAADMLPVAGKGARSQGDGRDTLPDALAILRAVAASMDIAGGGRLH